MLLFTNEMHMVHAMRHMHTEYHEFCNKSKFKMDLQVPTWNKTNKEDFENKRNSTMYGMTTSVHAGSVSLFGVVLPIYIFSVLCQGLRAYQYCRVGNEKGLYKPWLGPDFSRWLEYLLTSPLQIFVVATAFGFANRDTVTGLCGMQAALVLFGYDIEQQIKKIYKQEARPVQKTLTKQPLLSESDSEDQHWRAVAVLPGARSGQVEVLPRLAVPRGQLLVIRSLDRVRPWRGRQSNSMRSSR